MKLVRFRDPAGSIRRGVWQDDGVSFGGTTFGFEEIHVLPPSTPTKIVCAGLNYRDHVEEKGWGVPDRPRFFVKTPNVMAGHHDTITLPPNKDRVEFEGELGVVIGEQCREVGAAEAMDVVEGYTCLDDLSNRDDQLPEQNNVRAKCFDGALPAGPVVVSPADVPTDAALRTRVNGVVKQESTIDRLIYGVPEIIQAITDFMTLEPGDIVATGTPSGVANLADGDRVEVEIEGVGTLSHGIDRPA